MFAIINVYSFKNLNWSWEKQREIWNNTHFLTRILNDLCVEDVSFDLNCSSTCVQYLSHLIETFDLLCYEHAMSKFGVNHGLCSISIHTFVYSSTWSRVLIIATRFTQLNSLVCSCYQSTAMAQLFPTKMPHCQFELGDTEVIDTFTLDFGPYEPVNRWKRMPECDEFVGARY